MEFKITLPGIVPYFQNSGDQNSTLKPSRKRLVWGSWRKVEDYWKERIPICITYAGNQQCPKRDAATFRVSLMRLLGFSLYI